MHNYLRICTRLCLPGNSRQSCEISLLPMHCHCTTRTPGDFPPLFQGVLNSTQEREQLGVPWWSPSPAPLELSSSSTSGTLLQPAPPLSRRNCSKFQLCWGEIISRWCSSVACVSCVLFCGREVLRGLLPDEVWRQGSDLGCHLYLEVIGNLV